MVNLPFPGKRELETRAAYRLKSRPQGLNFHNGLCLRKRENSLCRG